MKAKIKFILLCPAKEIICDFEKFVSVLDDSFSIGWISIDMFTTKELNILSNACGVSIETHIDSVKNIFLRISIKKPFCKFELIPTEDDKEERIKFLTNKIDEMSSELNTLINK